MLNKEAIKQLKIIKESLMNCGGCEGARQSLTCIYLAIKALEFIDENFPNTFIDYLNGIKM